MSLQAERSAEIAVLGATPGGISAAVRAAREGMDVALIAYNDAVGGMMASGLSATDTKTKKARSPIVDEFVAAVADHYRNEYGEDSEQYELCNDGYHFEPHVAEAVFEELLADAGSVDVRYGYHPIGVDRDDDTVRSATFRQFSGDDEMRVEADVFIDATYEGDLAATAGIPYRVGRESKDEYNEPHAGVIYTSIGSRIHSGSTGEGDDAIQAYNYRLCLSRDPDNRRMPEKPDGYDREEYRYVLEDYDERQFDYDGEDGIEVLDEELPCPVRFMMVRDSLEEIAEQGFLIRPWGTELPNDKADLNTGDLPGEADDYPEGSWERREEIAKRHRDHILGLLYFLQHDEAIPEEYQREAREWGLAADEFTDNENFPWQLYVREGRRIRGADTFTEHDARMGEGIERSRIKDHSVAIAEYTLDSHGCRPVRRRGTREDGNWQLGDITVPSQIPFDVVVPETVDNVLVPVAVSSTHVGFNAIRYEPTWMQLGEVTGLAAAMGVKRDTAPSDLSVEKLQVELAETGNMLTFFNDIDLAGDEPWLPAMQYLGAKGFFTDYNARPEDPLPEDLAHHWAVLTAKIAAGEYDPMTEARRSTALGDAETASVTDYEELLETAFTCNNLEIDLSGLDDGVDTDGDLRRKDACLLSYRAIREKL